MAGPLAFYFHFGYFQPDLLVRTFLYCGRQGDLAFSRLNGNGGIFYITAPIYEVGMYYHSPFLARYFTIHSSWSDISREIRGMMKALSVGFLHIVGKKDKAIPGEKSIPSRLSGP